MARALPHPETQALLARTGVTATQLERWQRVGLVPKPTRVGTGRLYPSDIDAHLSAVRAVMRPGRYATVRAVLVVTGDGFAVSDELLKDSYTRLLDAELVSLADPYQFVVEVQASYMKKGSELLSKALKHLQKNSPQLAGQDLGFRLQALMDVVSRLALSTSNDQDIRSMVAVAGIDLSQFPSEWSDAMLQTLKPAAPTLGLSALSGAISDLSMESVRRMQPESTAWMGLLETFVKFRPDCSDCREYKSILKAVLMFWLASLEPHGGVEGLLKLDGPNPFANLV